MIKLLTKNSKMKLTMFQHPGTKFFNFDIPAFRSRTGLTTCPNAGKCLTGCYGQMNRFTFDKVKQAQEARLDVVLRGNLPSAMGQELQGVWRVSNGIPIFIRVHGTGDFFKTWYRKTWFSIMDKFPKIHFYAYTKMVKMFKGIQMPKNFRTIFSFGGKEDGLIEQGDRCAMVFPDEQQIGKGFANGSHDDYVAAASKCHKVGLVYHGWSSHAWGGRS